MAESLALVPHLGLRIFSSRRNVCLTAIKILERHHLRCRLRKLPLLLRSPRLAKGVLFVQLCKKPGLLCKHCTCCWRLLWFGGCIAFKTSQTKAMLSPRAISCLVVHCYAEDLHSRAYGSAIGGADVIAGALTRPAWAGFRRSWQWPSLGQTPPRCGEHHPSAPCAGR